jgi:1,2-diacylglycerol 3-beta-glucosyltransferase
MLHTTLIICGVISVPFICVYLSYSLLIIQLPDFKKKIRVPLQTRMIQVLNQKEFTFVFLLPCLNEEAVILGTIHAILDLNYKNMFVVVIDDASDDHTVDCVQSIKDTRVRLFKRKFPDARKGKGKALNSCYRQINKAVTRLGVNPDTVIIGAMDGDGHPSANLLLEAIEAFADPKVGAAQSRIRITNRNQLLPLMQDMEFSTTVGAMQNARAYFGSVGLGGNGQFTRLSALRTLGPSPWTTCLLEDFDLGLRILLQRWEIRFLSESYVAQQGLISIRRFIRQRTRWVQGNMQCLHYAKDIFQSHLPATAKLDLYYFLSQPWLNMLGTLLQFAACLVLMEIFTSGSLLYVISKISLLSYTFQLIVWVLLMFSPGFIWVWLYQNEFNDGSPKRSWQFVSVSLFFPIYNVLMLPSVWIALWRQIRRKTGWAKTERLAEQEMQESWPNPPTNQATYSAKAMD